VKEKTPANGSADEDDVVAEMVSLEASGAGGAAAPDGAVEADDAAEGADALEAGNAIEGIVTAEAAQVNDTGANECAAVRAAPCAPVEAGSDNGVDTNESVGAGETVGGSDAPDSVWLAGTGEAEDDAAEPDNARNEIGTSETTAGSGVA
jgi:hypothetical protein